MRTSLASVATVFLLTACATNGAEETAGTVYDPFEGWNRSVYAFNDRTDRIILEPVAKGYRAVTNEPIRGGVSNFLSNLNQPIVFANAVLQGKPGAALDTFGRFVVNTTVGIGGIFDPASAVGVPKHQEDFGQTLGVWGFSEGAYIVLPFLGPSNVRDAFGIGVDTAISPLNYTSFEGDTEFRIATGVVGVIAGRESLIEDIELLREQPEPYIFLRRNYTQSRQAAIRDGREEEDPFKDLPDLDAYDFGDEDFE